MKRVLALFLALSFVFAACCPLVLADGDPSVLSKIALPKITRVIFAIGKDTMDVDGKKVGIRPPYLYDDITFVPLRAIGEAFGAQVDWIGATQGITIKQGGKTIDMQIGSTAATVNGKAAALISAPQLQNAATMVPLRFVSEALGMDIIYDDVKNQVCAVVRDAGEPLPIDKRMLDDIKKMVVAKTAANGERFGDKFPEATSGSAYKLALNPNWVAGFYTRLNYICYDMSGNPAFITYATRNFPAIKAVFYRIGTNNAFHADIGVVFMLSFYEDYLRTGSEDSKKMIIEGADAMLERFKSPGYLQAFNVGGKNSVFAQENAYRMIIDNLSTIPILYTATELTGDIKYLETAETFIRLLQTYNVREDYTTAQTFVFNPDGTPNGPRVYQGYSDGSCWSRGQGWAIEGMAQAYRATDNVSYLNYTKNFADTYLKMLDDDFIPRWDLSLQNNEGEPKDTSSSGLAGCGMLYLYEATGDPFYKDMAYKILTVLYEKYSTKDDTRHEGLITNGVGNKPSKQNVGVSLIYGDYYFAELAKRFIDLENQQEVRQ